jgi:hypothetical protein
MSHVSRFHESTVAQDVVIYLRMGLAAVMT